MYKYIFCLFLCVTSALCYTEGQLCRHNGNGKRGVCVDARRCLSSLIDYKTHNEHVCWYRGPDPVVCCTDCQLINDTSNVLVRTKDNDWNNMGTHYFKTGSKAVDKCLEYTTKLDYPCALRGGLQRKLASNGTCHTYVKVRNWQAVGGVDARAGEYPHMALLGYGQDLASAEWQCGGSIISEWFIMTAGHCIYSVGKGQVRFAALGILKRSDPPEQWQSYLVHRIVKHPEYHPPSKYNDIALLQVNQKIKFSKLVLPACLNTGKLSYWAKAAGWGATGFRQRKADTLQVVNLQRFTESECADANQPNRLMRHGYNHTTQICYGHRTILSDTCNGDSGGPLQQKTRYGRCIFNIIGVTSAGKECGFVKNAGLYTRVSYFVPWIESVVWP